MGIQGIKEELCNGCRRCFNDCPMDVFRMDEATNKAHVAYPKDCMACFICEDECKPGAIIFTLDAVDKMCFPF
ncbi:MAG: ferredoxin family protein [Chloroflexi bacterium]|nr:ferredoxin family protein [Chloroflexota bacterium]